VLADGPTGPWLPEASRRRTAADPRISHRGRRRRAVASRQKSPCLPGIAIRRRRFHGEQRIGSRVLMRHVSSRPVHSSRTEEMPRETAAAEVHAPHTDQLRETGVSSESAARSDCPGRRRASEPATETPRRFTAFAWLSTIDALAPQGGSRRAAARGWFFVVRGVSVERVRATGVAGAWALVAFGHGAGASRRGLLRDRGRAASERLAAGLPWPLFLLQRGTAASRGAATRPSSRRTLLAPLFEQGCRRSLSRVALVAALADPWRRPPRTPRQSRLGLLLFRLPPRNSWRRLVVLFDSGYAAWPAPLPTAAAELTAASRWWLFGKRGYARLGCSSSAGRAELRGGARWWLFGHAATLA